MVMIYMTRFDYDHFKLSYDVYIIVVFKDDRYVKFL